MFHASTMMPADKHPEPVVINLQSLPDEIILGIVDFIDCWDQAIPCLCLTSWRLNSIVTPILYRNYRNTRGKSIRHLLATLVRRSDLIPHIKGLELEWNEDTTTFVSSRAYEDGILLSDAINKAGSALVLPPRVKEPLLAALALGEDVADLCLLLCLAHNVEFLSIQPPGVIRQLNQIDIIHALTNPPQDFVYARREIFSKLRRARFSNSDGITAISLSPIFRLPALRHLECHHCLDIDNESTDWPIELSPITSLKVEHSQCTTNSIVRMLRACKSLKHFSFDYGRLNPTLLLIDYAHLLEGLSYQRESLETLELTFSDSSMIWEYHARSAASGFSNFARLRTLNVSINAIMHRPNYPSATLEARGIQHSLPPSIRDLSIHYWPYTRRALMERTQFGDAWSSENLMRFALDIAECPNLEDLAIVLHPNQQEGHDLLGIKEAFRSRGVSFDWDFKSLPYPLRAFFGFEA